MSRKLLFQFLIISWIACLVCSEAAIADGGLTVQTVSDYSKNIHDTEAPFLEIPESVYDFGEAFESDSVMHTFKIKNTGTGTLKIIRVKSGCSCMPVSYDREIPPGGEGAIKLVFSLAGRRGKVVKIARIQSNDPRHIVFKLRLQGIVKSYN